MYLVLGLGVGLLVLQLLLPCLQACMGWICDWNDLQLFFCVDAASAQGSAK
jgi:hypothetical protein